MAGSFTFNETKTTLLVSDSSKYLAETDRERTEFRQLVNCVPFVPEEDLKTEGAFFVLFENYPVNCYNKEKQKSITSNLVINSQKLSNRGLNFGLFKFLLIMQFLKKKEKNTN